MNRMSFDTPVKINLIQAKIKKVIGHEVHQQNSIYWMPKIEVKDNFDRPKVKVSLVSKYNLSIAISFRDIDPPKM